MNFSRALRVGSALLLLGGSGAVIYLAGELPPVKGEPSSTTRSVRVAARTTTVVCHAAPELPGGVADDQDFTAVPVEPVAARLVGSFPRAGEAGLGVFSSGGASEELTGSPVRWFQGDPSSVGWAVVESIAEQAALVAGTSMWSVEAGDLRSLVATPCLPPASELWLVGGATTLGRSAVLELVNSGETTATVRTEGWGPTGPLKLPLLEAISLAPRTATRVLLEANAADVARLALQLTVTGGSVSAAVIDSALVGVTPQGVETIIPARAPATELVFPGVALDADSPAGANVLQMLNPGGEPATAAVEVLSAEGILPVVGATAVTLDAGAVFEIPLAGLPSGDHAVRIVSDRPVTGAIQIARAAGGEDLRMDRAWSVPMEPVTRAAVAIPDLVTARLVVTNPTAGEARVRVSRYGGEELAPLEIRLPGGSSTTVDAGGAAGLILESDLPLVAAAVLERTAPDGTLISVVPVTADADERQFVDVRVSGR